MAHTPGLWRVYRQFNVESETKEFVASCGVNGRNTAIAEANARLIAAAPSLLEACKIMLPTYERTCVHQEAITILNTIKQAIAKAEAKQ